MLKEIGIFYRNYNGKKCSYSTYTKRVYNGLSYEEAIYSGSIKKKLNRIGESGRICTKCKIFKYWFYFNKNKTLCKECSSVVSKGQYIKHKEKIIQKKKERRETEMGKLKIKLDKIFYSDINVKKIIQIEGKEKRIKRAAKGDIMKDKYFYFLNRGYDKDLLISLYGKHYL